MRPFSSVDGAAGRRRPVLVGALLLSVAASAACDGGGGGSPPPPGPQPPGRRVSSIRVLKDPGGRVSWSHARNLIAFDRAGSDDYYDIWVMNPDGTGERCLTCGKSALPGRHTGNPDWHPSGNYIVFQAQTRSLGSDDVATPGRGFGNDVFVMDSGGTRFAQLTETESRVGGVLHPHFSHTGDKLVWAERIGNGGGRYGEWALKVADFDADRLRIHNVRTFRPGERPDFYESHGFAREGTEIVFSGNLGPGHPENGIDIYRFNLSTEALVNLTGTNDEWDEHATLSPNGGHLVWMSSRGNAVPILTDYWLMNFDGSGKERLTFFNQQGHADFIPGGVTAGDSSWGPDGSRLVAYVIGNTTVRGGSIYMIELTSAVSETPGGWRTERDVPGDGLSAGPSRRAAPRQRTARPQDVSGLRAWSELADSMLRSGDLVRRLVRSDTLMPGRRHEWLAQVHRGVPVAGGELSRQSAGGQTVSMYGAVYDGAGQLDVTPTLREDEARAIVERLAGARLGPSRRAELVVLPLEGRFALAYRVRIMSSAGLQVYFVDAHTGTVLRKYSDLQSQQTQDTARGVLPDRKALPVTPMAGRTVTLDETRNPGVATFDLGGDAARTIDVINGVEELSWPDLAVAAGGGASAAARDAHAHAAVTYDYLLSRFGQRGLAEDTRMVSLVHPARRRPAGAAPALGGIFSTSAFYAGDGIVVFGEGLPEGERLDGRAWHHPSGGLDIVAHELGHAVLGEASRLLYYGESGGLNEGYADIFATGVEFASQPPGGPPQEGDYTIGEDVVVPGGLRSLARPAQRGQLDHVSRITDPADVHALGSIVGHVFYLAVEGGTNATSGVRVRGAGAARRAEIEQVFYRAFVLMLPSNATLADARQATGQAARDLFGAGSAAERAVAEAWTAVGVS